MSEIIVNPGICSLKSVITVTSEDMETANISITTDCPYVKQLEGELKDIDCLSECFSTFATSKIYLAAAKYLKHVACPVPMAMIKALEVACGFALPKDVAIVIKK